MELVLILHPLHPPRCDQDCVCCARAFMTGPRLHVSFIVGVVYFVTVLVPSFCVNVRLHLDTLCPPSSI